VKPAHGGEVVRGPLGERGAPRTVEGDGRARGAEDRHRAQVAGGAPEDQLTLTPEVVAEFNEIEKKFREKLRNGQIIVEVHYQEGERMKLWVREGAVFKP